MKKATHVALLFGFLALKANFALSLPESPIPQSISGARETYFFQAASLEVTDGKVTDKRVSDQLRWDLESYIALPAQNGCVRLIPGPDDRLVPIERATIEDAALSAESVVRARVTDLAPGFRSTGQGGTIVQFETIEALRGGDGPPERSRYFFVPIGSFRFAGRQFCAEAPDWPPLPRKGDEVVLMAPFAAWNDNDFFEVADERGIVVLPSDGGMPQASRTFAPSRHELRTGNELLEVIKRILPERNR